MKWEDLNIGEPKDGEIKVKNKAIGINFLDVYMRKGLVPGLSPPLPFTPGICFNAFSFLILYCNPFEVFHRLPIKYVFGVPKSTINLKVWRLPEL